MLSTRKGILLFGGVLALLAACAPAESAKEENALGKPSSGTYTVHKVSNAWTLDSVQQDSLWLAAEPLQDFVFPWQDRTPPSTEFRAVYNNAHFFFQFVVEDPDLVLGDDLDQNLAVIGSDRVELFFAANDSLNPYYQLEMDPRTWVFDAKSTLYRKVDENWNWPGMKTFATIAAPGYVLQGKIPMATFDDLGLWQNQEKTRLLCGVFRAEFEALAPDSVKHNWISWILPQSPTPDFHISSAFGQFQFEK